MDYSACIDMVQFNNDQECLTQCVVYDKTPGSEQKKINIIARPTYKVTKVMRDIITQFHYQQFDLVLQPSSDEDLVYLNDCESSLIYDVPGFRPQMKNILVLLPPGEWDNDVKKRFELTTNPLKKQQQQQQQPQQPQLPLESVETTIGDGKSDGCVGKRTHQKTNANMLNSCNNNNINTTTSSSSSNNIRNNISESFNLGTTTNNNNNNFMNMQNQNMIAALTVDTTTAAANAATNAVIPTTTVTASLLNPTTTIDGAMTTTLGAKVTDNPLTDTFNLSPMSDNEHCLSYDDDLDLVLGASASPTGTEPMHGDRMLGDGLLNSPGNNVDSSDDTYQIRMELEAKVSALGNVSDESTEKTKNCEGFPFPSTSTSTSASASVSASALESANAHIAAAINNSYVGLVNQAMTCYLNSLLQALYMTPEFRNALYRWEFDNDNEAKNIPYQLQKLFLNLQTSKKSAVETTDLTRSFGWDSNEAWQQHDIQELCRVMFDALEHKFCNTKQANLISNLYEGKMIDYVKCLECNTEKSRADTFLDIPLPVRPFGSSVAYGSIEEALRAFVQPEILDGNNQYFCEKCNKKCDAHKGLKFSNFPYILTLHLKRFDFDYQTMHRIKLNDKVTFAQKLNLNSFVSDGKKGGTPFPAGNAGYVLNGLNGVASSNTDDCSTTDSGSAMEEDNCSSGIATTANSSQHENDINDEDEGIDMSSSTDNHRNSINAEELMKHESGPYIYDLFAIMIHSGSASGGHYYAYIKEFHNNEWYCFNDQSVTPITQEDIQKSFGGASNKAYYSSVYSSSTNAYMLMYRQIDPKRNENVMSVQDFPEHINRLLPKLHMEDEQRPSRSGGHRSHDLSLPELIKPRVYFYNPLYKKLKLTRVYVSRHYDINTILDSAHHLLNVDEFAPVERCRLVGYDSSSEDILQSFENVTDPALTEIRASWDGALDFLLEYRGEGQEFEVYEPGGCTWYLYVVALATMEMDGPYLVYSSSHECNNILKRSIAKRLHVKEDQLLLATLPSKKAFVAYDPQPTRESQEHLQTIVKSHFRNLTYLYIYTPNTDPHTLELLGIPAYESSSSSPPPSPSITPAATAPEMGSDVTDSVMMNSCSPLNYINTNNTAATVATAVTAIGGDSLVFNGNAFDYSQRESPLPPIANNISQESNSEDSSLSDGDRTLVESLQNRGGGDSQFSSNSHSPQLSSPDDASNADSLNRIHAFFNGTSQHESESILGQNRPQFFYAMKLEAGPVAMDGNAAVSSSSKQSAARSTTITDSVNEDIGRKPAHSYKIIVASHMKIGVFKQHIERLIRVPSNYFTIKRKHDTSDAMSPENSLVFLNEGETLIVELGKELLPDEYRTKIFYMRLSDLNNDSGKLLCVCEWMFNGRTTVLEAKSDLIAKLQRIDPKYESLSLDNLRIWLKGGRNPTKILQDADTLVTDVRSTLPTEFLLQECEQGVNPQPNEDSLTLFCRRWHPDTLQLDNFQEVTLEKNSELRNVLASISDIPEEHISYSKITITNFPCTNINLMSVNSSLSWFSVSASVDKYPLSTTISGTVFFYKDSREIPKELNNDERREMNAKEKTRLDRLGCSSSSIYSPRRERALKIYLDSPPKVSSINTTADSVSLADPIDVAASGETSSGTATTNVAGD